MQLPRTRTLFKSVSTLAVVATQAIATPALAAETRADKGKRSTSLVAETAATKAQVHAGTRKTSQAKSTTQGDEPPPELTGALPQAPIADRALRAAKKKQAEPGRSTDTQEEKSVKGTSQEKAPAVETDEAKKGKNTLGVDPDSSYAKKSDDVSSSQGESKSAAPAQSYCFPIEQTPGYAQRGADKASKARKAQGTQEEPLFTPTSAKKKKRFATKTKKASKRTAARSGKAHSQAREALAQKAEKTKRKAKTCYAPQVSFTRLGQPTETTFALTTCDGKPAPGALRALTCLALPFDASQAPSPEGHTHHAATQLDAGDTTKGAAPKAVPKGNTSSSQTGKHAAKTSHAESLEGASSARKDGSEEGLLEAGIVARLQAIAKKFPGKTITLVSGYRPSSKGSPHASRRAFDIRIVGVTNEALVAACKSLADTGCGYYPNSYHVHLDVRPKGAGHVSWIDISGPGEKAHYVKQWPLPKKSTESANEGATPPSVDPDDTVEKGPEMPTQEAGNEATKAPENKAKEAASEPKKASEDESASATPPKASAGSEGTSSPKPTSDEGSMPIEDSSKK